MTAITAHILIGSPHPNDGGLNARHKLTLSEGDRPAWAMQKFRRTASGALAPQRIVWIPTVENMLEDALLMAAVHVVESEAVRTLFNEFSGNLDANRLLMYDTFTDDQRRQLYQACRQIRQFPKVILCIFEGSSIGAQISALEHYSMQCEVLMPVYTRIYSHWSGETIIKGTLQPA